MAQAFTLSAKANFRKVLREVQALCAPDMSPEWELVKACGFRIVLGDRVERVRRDESFYYRPNAPHKLVNAGKGPCRVLWVSTPPSF